RRGGGGVLPSARLPTAHAGSGKLPQRSLELARELRGVEEVLDHDDVGIGLADRLHELGRGEDDLGVLRDRNHCADVGGRDLRVDPKAPEHALGIDLEDARTADPGAADGDDLHSCLPMIRCTSAAVVALSSAAMAPESLKMFASSATDARCASGRLTARPSTTLTGSLCGCPNATGVDSVTTASPSPSTSGPGRACARARPGAMTTYGPCSSIMRIISSA